MHMAIQRLTPADLRLRIASDALGFSDTSELVQQPLPWVGQERAEPAGQGRQPRRRQRAGPR